MYPSKKDEVNKLFPTFTQNVPSA